MKNQLLQDFTCLIPLYKSKRFLSIIEENIEEHLKYGAHVLVSDMHGYDDVPEMLKARYGQHENVVIHVGSNGGDWVDNINFLIRQTETRFARIVPHDDTALPGSSAALVALLLKHPDAILATGEAELLDVQGKPLPAAFHPHILPQAYTCPSTLDGALSFLWLGKFPGSFKGVFDAQVVRERQLYIKKTPGLVVADHLWVNALFTAGRFEFLPMKVLAKRFYPESTHKSWRYTPEVYLGIGDVLYEYFREQIADEGLLAKARFVIYHNAIRRARYCSDEIGHYPGYNAVSPMEGGGNKPIFPPR
ncbi:MAG: hypothetical protein RI973_1731 [Bacteroidota bacterium]|jgi:hypothetical protein